MKISIDGKGRYQDNILIERLWRTVKYEEVFTGKREPIIGRRDGILT